MDQKQPNRTIFAAFNYSSCTRKLWQHLNLILWIQIRNPETQISPQVSPMQNKDQLNRFGWRTPASRREKRRLFFPPRWNRFFSNMSPSWSIFHLFVFHLVASRFVTIPNGQYQRAVSWPKIMDGRARWWNIEEFESGLWGEKRISSQACHLGANKRHESGHPQWKPASLLRFFFLLWALEHFCCHKPSILPESVKDTSTLPVQPCSAPARYSSSGTSFINSIAFSYLPMFWREFTLALTSTSPSELYWNGIQPV